MQTTQLRKVGGSVMLSIPPSLLNILHLKAGATVGIDVQNNQLIIDPSPRPRYSLEALLSACDEHMPLSDEDKAWANQPPVGQELL
jgi:antitoxin ChpS